MSYKIARFDQGDNHFHTAETPVVVLLFYQIVLTTIFRSWIVSYIHREWLLHMFPEFHADKPLDKFIRPGIEPEHINESVLGRALDQLYELGVSEVYLSLAVKAITVLKLPCKALNLDSTSFHVDGRCS